MRRLVGAASICVWITAIPPITKGDSMAKPNYNYQKRQRELAKKKKKEEKRKNKLEKKAQQSAEEATAPSDDESPS